jgi:hypothetical protein
VEIFTSVVSFLHRELLLPPLETGKRKTFNQYVIRKRYISDSDWLKSKGKILESREWKFRKEDW